MSTTQHEHDDLTREDADMDIALLDKLKMTREGWRLDPILHESLTVIINQYVTECGEQEKALAEALADNAALVEALKGMFIENLTYKTEASAISLLAQPHPGASFLGLMQRIGEALQAAYEIYIDGEGYADEGILAVVAEYEALQTEGH